VKALAQMISRGLAAVLVVMICLPTAAGQTRYSDLLALCYHDVVDTYEKTLIDDMAVTVDTLVQHFSWLAANGYEPINLAQWQAAAHGGALPDKPVLLSFDDGYSSFRSRVLPLLELYGFPAVLAPVTSWIDTPQSTPVKYGNELRAREDFLTWNELVEIQASGMVEIASHSHDLHQGVVANSYGNLLPAAAAHRFDAADGYETDEQYSARVGSDLQRSVVLLDSELGTQPAVMVWPYGAYNAAVADVAAGAGMPLAMTLNDQPNRVGSDAIHRYLVSAETDLGSLVHAAERTFDDAPPRRSPLRAAHIDLDYVFDADPVQQSANLDALLDRIKEMQITTVFLQAFADPDGDGVADALYFSNRHLPVRGDLFSRVAWQLKTRAGVDVFAWMPVLAFKLPDAARNQQLAVVSADGSHLQRYHRLSPYHDEARRLIKEIYADLGRSGRFAGVLFHDDAFLTDREDVSAAAAAQFVSVDGAVAKTAHLIEFTRELAQVLRRWQPSLRTARNLYARVLEQPESEQWFAQNFDAFLQAYDYTAVMTMPYLEQVEHPQGWLKKMIGLVASREDALQRTVFHLQTRDWRANRRVSNRTLRHQFDLLLRSGALNIAYYPDDFLGNHPDLRMVRSRLSINAHPALKR